MSSVGNGNGLTGQYYNSTNLDPSTLVLTRIDPTLNFNWESRSPSALVSADNFSLRSTGQVQAKTTERYTFYTNSDDGIRLSIDGKKLIDRWDDHFPVEDSASIDLIEGRKYDIKVEYYERSGGAVNQLSWSSASIGKQIIPQSQLYSSQGSTAQGLTAQYYKSRDLNPDTLITTKIDSNINFDWKNGFPVNGVPVDQFSVRWTGKVTAPTNGEYTFATTADDGVRLWVDGKQLVNNWTTHATQRDEGKIYLTAGQHDIRLEYFEEWGGAVAKLSWSGPGFGDQIIPANAFGGIPPNSTPVPSPVPTSPISTPNPTNKLDPAFNDSDFGVPNDANPDGVPSYYSWYKSAAQPGWGNSPPLDWKAVVPWGQVYAAEGWHPEQAPNTRVQIKNMELWILSKSTNQWSKVASAEKVGGSAFASAFGNNGNKGVTVKDEAANGGGTSVTAGNGFNYHFWTNRVDMNPSDIGGMYTRFEARLTLDNPNGVDDRDSSRYIANAGADYWRSKTAAWASDWSNNGGVAGGRFKYVKNDWQNFSMTTIKTEDIVKNPPPLG
jgi:hypothetical protein